MKKLVLIISSLMITVFCFGQDEFETIQLGKVKELPMRDADVSYVVLNQTKCRKGCALNFESKNDSVFSISDGKVDTVFDIGRRNVLVIKDSANRILSYINLSVVYVSKGEPLNKGVLLGIVFKNLLLNISDKTGKSLTENKIWKIVKDE